MITAGCIRNLISVPFAYIQKELFLMTITVSGDSPSPPNPTYSSLCIRKLLHWSSKVKEWPSTQHVSALFPQNQRSLHWILCPLKEALSYDYGTMCLTRELCPQDRLLCWLWHFYASEPWFTSKLQRSSRALCTAGLCGPSFPDSMRQSEASYPSAHTTLHLLAGAKSVYVHNGRRGPSTVMC